MTIFMILIHILGPESDDRRVNISEDGDYKRTALLLIAASLFFQTLHPLCIQFLSVCQIQQLQLLMNQ